jgi:hypothetical protein
MVGKRGVENCLRKGAKTPWKKTKGDRVSPAGLGPSTWQVGKEGKKCKNLVKTSFFELFGFSVIFGPRSLKK